MKVLLLMKSYMDLDNIPNILQTIEEMFDFHNIYAILSFGCNSLFDWKHKGSTILVLTMCRPYSDHVVKTIGHKVGLEPTKGSFSLVG